MRTLIRSRKMWAIAALAALAGGGSVYVIHPDHLGAACTGAGCTAQATVTLSATVNPNCSISVTSNTSGSLDLTTNTPSSGTQVAIVLEKCNAKNGYSVSVASLNAGKLKGQTAAPADELPYQLRYDTVQVNFTDSLPVIALSNQPRTTGTGTERLINIIFSGATANLVEDTYTDTVTVTLSAS